MGLATNITYYVNGVKADAANEVKLLVNDNNPSSREAAKAKLLRVSKVLFRKFEWDFPSEIEKAIKAYRQAQISMPFGTVSFEINRGKIDAFSVVVKSKN